MAFVTHAVHLVPNWRDLEDSMAVVNVVVAMYHIRNHEWHYGNSWMLCSFHVFMHINIHCHHWSTMTINLICPNEINFGYVN